MKPPEKKRKVGGQPKYKPEIHDTAAVTMISLGATDMVLAKGLGIARMTLNRWKLEYPDFAAKLVKAKKEYDDGVVVKALYKRAVGYDYTEVTRELRLPPQEDGKEQGPPVLTVVKEVKKHLPADVIAMLFWLKNRQPDDWKDRPMVSVEDNRNQSFSLTINIGASG